MTSSSTSSSSSTHLHKYPYSSPHTLSKPHSPRAMYGHTNHSLFSDFLGHFPASDVPPPPFIFPVAPPPPPPPHLSLSAVDDFDSVSISDALLPLNSDLGNSCSSGGSSSSLTTSYSTQRPSFIQRSVSSHSLQHNGRHPHPISLVSEFLESESPVRRVYSTGDLQRINMMQHHHRPEISISNDTSIIEGMMTKASRYSPEEKKERIERYRSKRNQRNFNKKIKYACRKTLADSRPRIRGRFARNEEIEKGSQSQWSNLGGEECEEDDDNWTNFLDAFSANLVP
ncbi:hypothetical protein AAG906_032161 [Vitis piasezkii]